MLRYNSVLLEIFEVFFAWILELFPKLSREMVTRTVAKNCLKIVLRENTNTFCAKLSFLMSFLEKNGTKKTL